MIDEKHLTEVIDKIYSIDCGQKKNCEECKNGLQWCPKEYADEIRVGLLKISENTSVCECILKQIQ